MEKIVQRQIENEYVYNLLEMMIDEASIKGNNQIASAFKGLQEVVGIGIEKGKNEMLANADYKKSYMQAKEKINTLMLGKSDLLGKIMEIEELNVILLSIE